MKILIISNYKPGTGGISGQVEKIYQHLSKEGIESRIFNSGTSKWNKITAPIRLLVNSKGYNVFHIHTCSFVGFYSAIIGIIFGKLLKKRIILTYHGGDCDAFFSQYPKITKFFLHKTDTNIVLSGYIGSIFEKYSIPYVIIPNIIELDSSRFKPRKKIKPNYISIRTLRPLYNIKCIIQAFQIVQHKIPDATLLILGDGSQRNELEEYVNTNQIPNITFVGHVDNSQIYNYLDQADIMLSSPIIDNMPVSILEGMNAGLLVISSNVGGIPYMIEDNNNGLLFESKNIGDLVEKMIFPIKNPIATEQIIYNAHKKLQYYSWNEVWKHLSLVYAD